MAATSCCVVRMGFSSLLLTILVADWRWISEEQLRRRVSSHLAVRTVQVLCFKSMHCELMSRAPDPIARCLSVALPALVPVASCRHPLTHTRAC